MMSPDRTATSNGLSYDAADEDDASIDLSQEARCCYICYQNETETEPLITACACRGSIGFVHEACLIKWIQKSRRSSCMQCGVPFMTATRYQNPAWCIADNLRLCGVSGVSMLASCALFGLYLLTFYLSVAVGGGGTGRNAIDVLANVGRVSKMYLALLLTAYSLLLVFKTRVWNMLHDSMQHDSFHDFLEEGGALVASNNMSASIPHLLGIHVMSTAFVFAKRLLQALIDRHSETVIIPAPTTVAKGKKTSSRSAAARS